jgi:hypothetical protein
MLIRQTQRIHVRHKATHDALCRVFSQWLGVHHEVICHAPRVAELRHCKSSYAGMPMLAVYVVRPRGMNYTILYGVIYETSVCLDAVYWQSELLDCISPHLCRRRLRFEYLKHLGGAGHPGCI